jgi:hypothetical protein
MSLREEALVRIKLPIKAALLKLRRESYVPKVFCIGYNKTGTTTIGKALQSLGFRNASFNRDLWLKKYARKDYDAIIRYTAKFDSFSDLPWLKEDVIPVMDRAFPGSKFVYLTRDEESWKHSFSNWRYKVFGVYPDIETAWAEYKKHEAFVRDYFKDAASDRFLELDVRDPIGFKKLAQFVGKSTNEKALPRHNAT